MATTTPSSPTDMTGQVLTEAARRMLPVLATKVMAALADQAVARIEGLADRLDESRDRPAAARGAAPAGAPEQEGSGSSAALGGVGAFVMEQAKVLLDLVVRLMAQAAEMLRRATERLRARRAPEGIEAEAEELDDIDLDESEYEFSDSDVDEDVDEHEDDRVPA